MAKRKRTNNDQQSTTQKKDPPTRTQLKTGDKLMYKTDRKIELKYC
jgi:hypothetical protein